MKAVYITEQGGSEVLTFGDMEDPVMGENEVLISIKSAAINRFDLYARSGENRVPINFPRILGEDLSGEVVDASLLGLQQGIIPGGRVVVDPRIPCNICPSCKIGQDENCIDRKDLGYDLDGSYAQLISVPAQNVYQIPDELSYDEAAALPIAFKTAWRMLVTKADVQPGNTVLIHAAGSGVGSAAIMIGKLLGCRIITTAGADWKLEKATDLGADHVINYEKNQNFAEAVYDVTEGEGVDVIIDSIGAPIWTESIKCLKKQGKFVTCGVTGGHKAELHLGQLFLQGYEIMGVGGFRSSEFGAIMNLVNNKKLKGIVGPTFSLSECSDAHNTMESRDFFGKIILNP
ncbi:MAG: zinc-binding dehydrogenase [Chloroflexota bacterium]|nr:zinc-binding dehydrogenase [Chloroflexota bacterium]